MKCASLQQAPFSNTSFSAPPQGPEPLASRQEVRPARPAARGEHLPWRRKMEELPLDRGSPAEPVHGPGLRG